LKLLFDEKVAHAYHQWYETKKGKLADGLEKELVLKIGELRFGENILDVGCGTGNHLQFFVAMGMKTTGIDISLPMLRVAMKTLSKTTGLCLAKAEALPFKARTFDCIVLMTTLEFVEDPLETLKEAIRVSKNRILLGVLNRYSLTGMIRRIKGLLHSSIYNEARFYSIWELKKLVSQALQKFSMNWASVLIFPLSFQQKVRPLERLLSFRKNPLGAFLAVRISKECLPERRDFGVKTEE
jgi:ubiquinone/menaquinone biosynthesis C-methylase UbiE